MLDRLSSVVAIIRRQDGRFLLCQRTSGDRTFSGWCFPGGKYDPKTEDLLGGICRELTEELGNDVVENIHFTRVLTPRVSFSTRLQRHFDIEVLEGILDGPSEDVRLSDEYQDLCWVSARQALTMALSGNATRSIITEMATGEVLYWPLAGATPLLPDAPGQFGAVRKKDIHTGVDLYCEVGTDVLAVEDGTVVLVEVFTGPNTTPPSPWWNETHAVLIEGRHGVITYGEIQPSVRVGDRVRGGQIIGRVASPVLKTFKGRPMVMLHFERMAPQTRETFWWPLDTPRPAPLLDPTSLLTKVAGLKVQTFDLDEYNGTSFRIDP